MTKAVTLDGNPSKSLTHGNEQTNPPGELRHEVFSIKLITYQMISETLDRTSQIDLTTVFTVKKTTLNHALKFGQNPVTDIV